MNILIFHLGSSILVALTALLFCQENDKVMKNTFNPSYESLISVKIVVLYDNYHFSEGLETDWGFSCIITGAKNTILFDTGTHGAILARNMEKLSIDPGIIETVILSHDHGDHTGGVNDFLKMNPKVDVYVLTSYNDELKSAVTRAGARVKEADEPAEICENVFTTGRMGSRIEEQSLILRTVKGNIVITGCAHPGIVEIVERTRKLIPGDVCLTMGGFHLLRDSEDSINQQIEKLKTRNAAPSHCSGDLTLELFKKSFGKHFLKIGVGKTITLEDIF